MDNLIEKRKRYLVEIEVNEKILREERNQLGDEFDIEELITDEFGWLYKSGIYITELKEYRKPNKAA